MFEEFVEQQFCYWKLIFFVLLFDIYRLPVKPFRLKGWADDFAIQSARMLEASEENCI